MESMGLILGISALIGISVSIIVARLLYKNGITFWVGVFFIIMVNITVILTVFEFSENQVIDKIIGITLIISSALGLMYIFDKLIGKGLRELSDSINVLADGKLNISIDKAYSKRKSEVGILGRSLEKLIDNQKRSVHLAKMVAEGKLYFNTDQLNKEAELDRALIEMVTKLREISNNIKLSAEQVGFGSHELSSTAQLISQGASEQAASAEEIASAMEEMATNNEHNTDNAQQANVIAKSVADKIKIIDGSITDTTLAMKNISEKISIITDIAEKTDILAINAAIEAARAGELGKGFAVVAAEVRDLAEHSQKAADEIVSVSRKSMEQVNQSKKLLDEALPQIQKTTNLVNEIAAASLEQSNGIAEVNQGIQQLSTVIQQNSSSSQQMAASSEELSGQAEAMNDTIDFFKITQHDENKLAENDIRNQIEKLTALLKGKQESSDKRKNTSKTTANKKSTRISGVDINLDDDNFESY